jgi:hypothetical protein
VTENGVTGNGIPFDLSLPKTSTFQALRRITSGWPVICQLHRIYAKDMREITLKRFFLEDVSAEALAEDVSGSVIHLDQIASTVQVEDMKEQFELQRAHFIRLCEAALSKALPPASLAAVAFALVASDAFWWEDEVISEVVADWSAPEINYPLTEETLAMHRDWLTGLAEPPERPRLPAASRPGKLISRRTTVRISRGS